MADPKVTTFVYNHDIRGLANRVNRFIKEMIASISSDVSQMSVFDQERLQSYLDNINGYLAWVVASPQLDLPETSPMQWPLDPAEVVPQLENQAVTDIVTLLGLAREELINSQSARMGSGMIPFDATRFSAVILKAQKFLNDYIKTLTPIDLPASSPMAPMAPAGNKGV